MLAVTIVDAQDEPPFRSQPGITLGVSRGTLGRAMMPPVDFEGDLKFGPSEVKAVAPHAMLLVDVNARTEASLIQTSGSQVLQVGA